MRLPREDQRPFKAMMHDGDDLGREGEKRSSPQLGMQAIRLGLEVVPIGGEEAAKTNTALSPNS